MKCVLNQHYVLGWRHSFTNAVKCSLSTMLSDNSTPTMKFTIPSRVPSFKYIYVLSDKEPSVERVPKGSNVWDLSTIPYLAVHLVQWRLRWVVLIPFYHVNLYTAFHSGTLLMICHCNKFKIFPTLCNFFPFSFSCFEKL